MENFKTYTEMIQKTLDLEAITTQNLFIVKSTFKPELEELRNELNDIESKIKKAFDKVRIINEVIFIWDSFLNNHSILKVSDALDSKNIKLESNAQNGYYFRISRKVFLGENFFERKILKNYLKL